jgi:hypothetical protein
LVSVSGFCGDVWAQKTIVFCEFVAFVESDFANVGTSILFWDCGFVFRAACGCLVEEWMRA